MRRQERYSAILSYLWEVRPTFGVLRHGDEGSVTVRTLGYEKHEQLLPLFSYTGSPSLITSDTAPGIIFWFAV